MPGSKFDDEHKDGALAPRLQFDQPKDMDLLDRVSAKFARINREAAQLGVAMRRTPRTV